VLFLLFEPNLALHLVLGFNMVVGALGMLLLLRELNLAWPATIGGALAFQLGDPMAQLTGWSPTHNGPWTWVPWALLMCERLLRAPTRTRIVGLAAVLSLVILPGWVLISALTYQLIALRVAWEVCTRRDVGSLRAATAVAVALVLMPLLVAVQLIPAVELSRQTFRVGTEVQEFVKFGGMPFPKNITPIPPGPHSGHQNAFRAKSRSSGGSRMAPCWLTALIREISGRSRLSSPRRPCLLK